MSVYAILAPAVPTTTYDEVQLYDRALTAAEIGQLYAAGGAAPGTDPQEDYGWEEAYGPSYPWTPGDVPVLGNGLCRVRYIATINGWALDVYAPGLGYTEVGRVTAWTQAAAAGAWVQLATLKSAQLIDWTPERAVVLAVIAAGAVRARLYITLERGWHGPRWELYPAPVGGTAQGAQLRTTLYNAVAPAVYAGSDRLGGSGPVRGTQDAWDAQELTQTTDPWLALLQEQVLAGQTWLQAGLHARTYTDTVAYGTGRPAAGLCADAGSAQAGYLQVVTPVLWRSSAYIEAERLLGAPGATTTVVADGAASGGSAVQDTQAAATNATVVLPPARTYLPLGWFAVWARVAAVDAGATVSIKALWTGEGVGTGTVTRTAQTYGWLYLGINQRDDPADSLSVTAWRSAGTGAVRLDAIVLAPLTRPVAADPAYNGMFDIAGQHLWRARAVPELVAR